MFQYLFFAIMLIVSAQISANSLLEDFEDGCSRNSLGQQWFYFSDVKDGGNSKILNSALLSNGGYEEFTPDTPGFSSSHCGRLEFELGDTASEMHNSWANFVGIGTDIAVPGSTFDLRGSQGITFRARGTDKLTLCCELITSNVFDYGYHRVFVNLSSGWTYYSFAFSDFWQPEDNCWPISVDLDLTKMQKITWKVFDNINGQGGDEKKIQQSGFFEIDDVFIMDSSEKTIVTTSTYTQHSSSLEPVQVRSLVNPAGRFTPVSRAVSSGVYLWKPTADGKPGKAVFSIDQGKNGSIRRGISHE